jgi:ankyrin repeat protein
MKPLIAAVAATLATALLVPADDQADDSTQALSIAIVTDKNAQGAAVINRDGEFSVVFSNRSQTPIRLWDAHCEPGYETLSFRFEDDDGTPSRMHPLPRHSRDWKNKPPATLTIPAGATLSWRVRPSSIWGGRIWTGVPEPNTGKPVSLTAVFEIKPGGLATDHGVWTGRILSDAVAVLVSDPNLTTPHRYLEEGCPKQALRLMQADPKWISRTDKNQQTPLHIAAHYGHLDVVRWLLSHGADINARCYNSFTPLHFARDPEVVKLILANKPDVNADSAGGTLLRDVSRDYAHLATIPEFGPERDKALAVAHLLIDAGADYDLLSACCLGDVARAQLLLKDKKLARDKDAMRAAAKYGRTEIVKLLLQRGANPEDADYGGLTVSYFAIEHADVLKMLFDAGANPRVTVEYHGNGWGPQGSTLLHEAAKKDAFESAKLLLKRGANVEAATPRGSTPLHEACGTGHLTIVELLLEHKADPTARTDDGSTPMSVAESAIRPEKEEDNVRLRAVIRALQRAGIEIDLFAAIACDDIQRVAEIVKADPKSMEQRNPRGRAALHRAVTLDRRAITKLLLESGCNPDIRSEDTGSGHEGGTALLDAAFWGHLDIAQMLIEHGTDVNARAKAGAVPLHEAARLKHPEIVLLLLKHGADVNATDDKGATPLDWGRSYGDAREMSELLRSHGGRGKNDKQAAE